MENGEWRMENGEWRMENGEWRMENGEWRIWCEGWFHDVFGLLDSFHLVYVLPVEKPAF
jgi:hypothetical protein